MDLRHPYLTGQLIAYIGNKRSLLPFLHEVFSGLVPDPTRASFLDPFAGHRRRVAPGTHDGVRGRGE